MGYTNQTNGMPRLKYSEKTFREMYEALRDLVHKFQVVGEIIGLTESHISNELSRAKKALTKAE